MVLARLLAVRLLHLVGRMRSRLTPSTAYGILGHGAHVPPSAFFLRWALYFCHTPAYSTLRSRRRSLLQRQASRTPSWPRPMISGKGRRAGPAGYDVERRQAGCSCPMPLVVLVGRTPRPSGRRTGPDAAPCSAAFPTRDPRYYDEQLAHITERLAEAAGRPRRAQARSPAPAGRWRPARPRWRHTAVAGVRAPDGTASPTAAAPVRARHVAVVMPVVPGTCGRPSATVRSAA